MSPPPPEHRPEPELSKQAIDKRIRRIFQPRADGTYQVSEDFVKQFNTKGEQRDALMIMFEKCNYEPDWACVSFLFLSSKPCFRRRR